MAEQKSERTDLQNEGKDQVFMDVDRMINEGMAGGTVRVHGDHLTNIEEARDFFAEDPPHEIK